MLNERKTEDIVSDRLRANGYYRSNSHVLVEKQQSDSARINKLLKNASKKGPGVGRPEFIITSEDISDFLIVIECKASPKQHISSSLKQYDLYAVDGVLLYAEHLSKEFDVLAIAVSGQTEAQLRISHYLYLKGARGSVEFDAANDVHSFDEYYTELLQSDAKFNQDYDALLGFTRSLNSQLKSKKVKEAHRGFLISGILIALQNRAFRESYKAHRTAKQIAKNIVETINSEFENAKLSTERREILRQEFSFVTTYRPITDDKDYLISLIENIDKNVNSFMKTHKYYDTIGQFYLEFLRYANNDKGLGIVLTPPHIADLFSELAETDRHSIVFDNCCGTAGLLIAAMKRMTKDAGADKQSQYKIKNQQLFGIEFQNDIYALAVSNMILHDDGKANICHGDCFSDHNLFSTLQRPDVGVLNPPYKDKRIRDDTEELEYVINNADSLQPGGTCVAIVPITCATAPSSWKEVLLSRHTLEAVMSMPIELFHNSKTNVVTCIMVFRAHRPHPKGKKTWFGYWRDDGFVKTKHRGRIDANNTWQQIKGRWVNAFLNREVIDSFSLLEEVGAADEWCVEAYLNTDYSMIKQTDLLEAAKRYLLSNVMTRHEMRARK